MMGTIVLSVVFTIAAAIFAFFGWASSTWERRARGWFIAAIVCFALATWGALEVLS